MSNDEKILQALTALLADVNDLKQGQTRLEKNLEVVETRVETIDKKIDQQGEQIMDAISDTATEIFKEQDDRISRIEDHVGLPHKN